MAAERPRLDRTVRDSGVQAEQLGSLELSPDC